MGFKWETSPEKAFVPGFDKYAALIHSEISIIALRRAPEITDWMKQNATWKDDTGEARRTLHTEVEWVLNKMVSVVMDYGVDYGVWLAFARGGKYDIIAPALDHWSKVLWDDIKELFRA